MGKKNKSKSPSLFSSLPSLQSCYVSPYSTDSIPSKVVDDPRRMTQSIILPFLGMLVPLPLALLSPLLLSLTNWRERKCNIMLIWLGKLPSKLKSTLLYLMGYNKCSLCLFSWRLVHH